jgi:pimeloyl-ACP methyl ester carboxylesterase
MPCRLSMFACLLVVGLSIGCQPTPAAMPWDDPLAALPPHDLGPVNPNRPPPEMARAVATRGFQDARSAQGDAARAMMYQEAMSGDTPLARRCLHRLDEVRPEWVRFARGNCREAVIGSLATPATARIAAPPLIVFASYDRTADVTTLDALAGKVDAQNLYGAMMRWDFYVSWSKQGPPDAPGDWTSNGVLVSPP